MVDMGEAEAVDEQVAEAELRDERDVEVSCEIELVEGKHQHVDKSQLRWPENYAGRRQPQVK